MGFFVFFIFLFLFLSHQLIYEMTSIIGYTRVPASKHYSIAPVKPIRTPFQDISTDHNANNNPRPTYHRMFSRETTGIVELIIDKRNKDTTAKKHITKLSNYTILLSIDLEGGGQQNLFTTVDIDASRDNLQKLMDSISRIAQEKTIHFLHILTLLKKLQTQQEKHRFMSCIDKHSGKILVYFPNTISSTSVDQTYEWLKYTLDFDIDRFKHWQLQRVESEEDATEIFDGESYFNDIHAFIHHIDLLIESNGLFSHPKRKQQQK